MEPTRTVPRGLMAVSVVERLLAEVRVVAAGAVAEAGGACGRRCDRPDGREVVVVDALRRHPDRRGARERRRQAGEVAETLSDHWTIRPQPSATLVSGHSKPLRSGARPRRRSGRREHPDPVQGGQVGDLLVLAGLLGRGCRGPPQSRRRSWPAPSRRRQGPARAPRSSRVDAHGVIVRNLVSVLMSTGPPPLRRWWMA